MSAQTNFNKSQDALECLNRRLGEQWEVEQLAAAKDRPECIVLLDRMQLTASSFEDDVILAIPGMKRTANHFLKRKSPQDFLPFRRVTRFTGGASVAHLIVLSQPQMRQIAPFKLTLIGRDEIGLQARDVISLLELIPDKKLILVEIAFDFGFDSGVDGAYVRRHALFGKSRANCVASIRGYDSWGSRKGAKFVRSYLK